MDKMASMATGGCHADGGQLSNPTKTQLRREGRKRARAAKHMFAFLMLRSFFQ